VILTAAYFLDNGVKEAERKYQNTAGQYRKEEGAAVARTILTKLGAQESLIEEVCYIIDHHHHRRLEETINFKTIYDADLLARLEEEVKEGTLDMEKLKAIVEEAFFTDSGRYLARGVLKDRK
jgi:hypothetical protein